MLHTKQLLSQNKPATEALAQFALCLLHGGQLPSSIGPATMESAVSATTGTSPVQLTVRADQVKVVGAGRRPPLLTGRQVTVTLVATVVADHANGTLSVTVDTADPSARRPRAKRAAKKSRRATSKRSSRSTRKRPVGRRAAANQPKEGTAA